jgi:hypothetical protein|tara:strand:+ start:7584 stop:8852 length:1269 start_codon:yes stop_codon:yes gene_type:complete
MEKNILSEVSRVREIMGISLHTNSKNINGVLIRESKPNRDHGIEYRIQVGVFDAKPSLEWLAKVKELGTPIKKIHIKGVLYRYVLKKSWTEWEGNLQLGIWAVQDTFPNAFIYAEKDGKRITVKQAKTIESGGDGDVGVEQGDVGGKEFDKVIFSDSLNVNNMPTFDPTKESEIYSCKVKGCSQWVSDTLQKFQGNAWHAHRNGHNKYSTYENAGTNLIPEMVSLFNLVNKNPKEESQEEKAKKISKSLVPNQEKFSNLKIDDIVGLFYEPSLNHTKAFFEGMTGYKKMGGEKAAADGPFMLNAKNNDVWTPEMLGQNIKFKGGNTLHKGQSAGINTHLGFVGAIVDGEPIIFHNIDKQVWATPLSKMNKNKTAIVWARGSGGGGTTETTVNKDEKTIKQKNTELLKKGLNLLYKKGKEFFD